MGLNSHTLLHLPAYHGHIDGMCSYAHENKFVQITMHQALTKCQRTASRLIQEVKKHHTLKWPIGKFDVLYKERKVINIKS